MAEKRFPIVKEGLPFLIPSLLLTILFILLGWRGLALLGILMSLFIVYFFRNPKRKIPSLKNIILSPADGKIVHLEVCEEERFLKQKALKVSIFMSPFDVHLNRSPISGRIIEAKYHPGKFLMANRNKASLLNEQNAFVLEGDENFKLLLVQIAGWLARRIVCYARVGDYLKQGEIFGMICFGSRIDLFLPVNVKPIVRVGQHVKGGESILGYRE
ncbi:MAG: phosphatidylserine decarboxylase family protein [Thermodesulfobacteriota bacterium]